MWGPPVISWFRFAPVTSSRFTYHKPVRDIGVMWTPTERYRGLSWPGASLIVGIPTSPPLSSADGRCFWRCKIAVQVPCRRLWGCSQRGDQQNWATRWCPQNVMWLCWFINHGKYRYIHIYLPWSLDIGVVNQLNANELGHLAAYMGMFTHQNGHHRWRRHFSNQGWSQIWSPQLGNLLTVAVSICFNIHWDSSCRILCFFYWLSASSVQFLTCLMTYEYQVLLIHTQMGGATSGRHPGQDSYEWVLESLTLCVLISADLGQIGQLFSRQLNSSATISQFKIFSDNSLKEFLCFGVKGNHPTKLFHFRMFIYFIFFWRSLNQTWFAGKKNII